MTYDRTCRKKQWKKTDNLVLFVFAGSIVGYFVFELLNVLSDSFLVNIQERSKDNKQNNDLKESM